MNSSVCRIASPSSTMVSKVPVPMSRLSSTSSRPADDGGATGAAGSGGFRSSGIGRDCVAEAVSSTCASSGPTSASSASEISALNTLTQRPHRTYPWPTRRSAAVTARFSAQLGQVVNMDQGAAPRRPASATQPSRPFQGARSNQRA